MPMFCNIRVMAATEKPRITETFQVNMKSSCLFASNGHVIELVTFFLEPSVQRGTVTYIMP